METDESLMLLNLVAKGDQPAFERLHRSHNRSVYAYVLNQLRNPADAEDVLSETMFDVWKGASTFKGHSTVRTWILGIARNKMLMRFRSRPPVHEDVDEFAEVLPDDSPNPLEIVSDRQRQKEVRKCMEGLSLPHRECLHLVFFEGCTVTEVAEIQRIPDGTVKTRLHHARLNIKACLARLLRAEGNLLSGA